MLYIFIIYLSRSVAVQYNNLIFAVAVVLVFVSSEVWCRMHDCVWTRAVFIVWNLLEDTAQLQPWPCSLAYCQEVKGVRVGLNLCSKTVSWADVLFAYSCTATSPFLQWKSFLGTILKNLEHWQCFLPYIRPELLELIEWQCLGGFVTQCWQKIFKKTL